MSLRFQVVFDCRDADRLAEFWSAALGYQVEPPPEGFGSWPEFLQARGIPVPEQGSISAVVDPAGAGPRVLFQRVPEAKRTKNRVHLDLHAGPDRAAKVAELVGAGGSIVGEIEENGLAWTVMTDPEGNEFCVAD
jgi:catechol 2,3-dioxygenase-like lactoylglutathione lyase family enzyme